MSLGMEKIVQSYPQICGGLRPRCWKISKLVNCIYWVIKNGLIRSMPPCIGFFCQNLPNIDVFSYFSPICFVLDLQLCDYIYKESHYTSNPSLCSAPAAPCSLPVVYESTIWGSYKANVLHSTAAVYTDFTTLLNGDGAFNNSCFEVYHSFG